MNGLMRHLSRALLIQEVHWGSLAPQMRSLIPPLSFQAHKGEMGRIAVIGGSEEYTGAPFYASKASLLFGADLVFIFCAQEALLPIKSYSPEFMVTALYSESETRNTPIENTKTSDYTSTIVGKIKKYMLRLHTIAIGPGLGRNVKLIPSFLSIIKLAVSENKNLVLDADAIWLINHNLEIIRGHQRCVLTPNIREFHALVEQNKREIEAVISKLAESSSSVSSDEETPFLAREFSREELMEMLSELNGTLPIDMPEPADEPSKDRIVRALQLRVLCQAMGGVTILLKGQFDTVCSGSVVFEIVGEKGSPRRCGGQGDILTGTTSVALHWASFLNGSYSISTGASQCLDIPPPVAASILAASATKRAASYAFEKMGRATTSPDVLGFLGPALADLEGEVGDEVDV